MEEGDKTNNLFFCLQFDYRTNMPENARVCRRQECRCWRFPFSFNFQSLLPPSTSFIAIHEKRRLPAKLSRHVCLTKRAKQEGRRSIVFAEHWSQLSKVLRARKKRSEASIVKNEQKPRSRAWHFHRGGAGNPEAANKRGWAGQGWWADICT